jgi:hypothetical protein
MSIVSQEGYEIHQIFSRKLLLIPLRLKFACAGADNRISSNILYCKVDGLVGSEKGDRGGLGHGDRISVRNNGQPESLVSQRMKRRQELSEDDRDYRCFNVIPDSTVSMSKEV